MRGLFLLITVRMMENKVVLKFDYLPCVNYAMVANGIGCCKTLIVENHDTRDWQHLVVTLKGTYIVESTAHVDSRSEERRVGKEC